MYERQRVWRACQACRRKKIKCDGEHPCQSCTRSKAECIYVEPHGNMRLVDPQYVPPTGILSPLFTWIWQQRDPLNTVIDTL